MAAVYSAFDAALGNYYGNDALAGDPDDAVEGERIARPYESRGLRAADGYLGLRVMWRWHKF